MGENKSSWSQVTALMHRQTGVLLNAEQAYLLEARLQPLVQAHKFTSLEAFVSAACAKPSTDALNMALVDAMTTHESYFFRDAFFWGYMQSDIIPSFQESRKRNLRIWSAACSYGQGAYSLAMLLQEVSPELFEQASITASDVSGAALARGKAGIYSSIEVNRGLSAPRLIKHFDKAPGGFQIKPHLRNKVRWSKENILDTSHAGNPFDIVLCRNVLIYFDAADRKIALKHLVESTVNKGYIGLGTSENLLKPQVAAGWSICDTSKGESDK